MTHPVTHADLVRGGRIVNPLANPPGKSKLTCAAQSHVSVGQKSNKNVVANNVIINLANYTFNI